MLHDAAMEIVPSTAYVLNDITYLPHYREEGAYVCPGFGTKNFKTFTAFELKLLGAKPSIEALWPRSWQR